MTLEFGTDGVRGVANDDLTPEFVVSLGHVAGTVLGGARSSPRPTCVLGRDTRASGPMLAAALAAGLAGAGVDVVDVGVLPTAGVALLGRDKGAAMGAVISASHNPAEDNGVKFFGPSGAKLPVDEEHEIQTRLHQTYAGGGDDTADLKMPTAGEVGRVEISSTAAADFEALLLETIDTSLDGLYVIVDAANGAACRVGPDALERAGARVDVINDTPDGTNINADCGATSPRGLADAVRAKGADLGVAFDGDADRLIPVDERGQILNGDHVLAICALAMQSEGRLAKDEIVATVMSNVGLRLLLKDHGIGVVEAAVGDRNVLNELDERGLALGGEQSGHVIYRALAPTGCGLLTALQLCRVVVRSETRLSELADRMIEFPQKLVNVPLADRRVLDNATRFWDAVSAAERDLGERGRVVVRPSGTEPKLRIMVQADAQEHVDRLIDDLVSEAGNLA